MDNQRLDLLILRFAEKTISPEEEKELLHYFVNPEYSQKIQDVIGHRWTHETFPSLLDHKQSGKLYASISREIGLTTYKVVKMHRHPATWIAAASVILLLLTAGGYFMFSKRTDVANAGAINLLPADIAPPSNSNAVLFFDNGNKINVGNIDIGLIPEQAGTTLTKLDNGRIVYQSNGQKSLRNTTCNTLFNPKGSKMISLVLSDGTNVWLNAESSIKYPIQFTGARREVQVSGEAYFEVAHNTHAPFIVTSGKTKIRVLGTQFNVNTYDKKGKVVVTLLKGSVNVSNGIGSGILQPGQQASVDSAISITSHSDTIAALAWKNELFDFRQMPVTEIMQQLERWYDVKVEYKGAMPGITLTGIINRNINASKVLEMLRLSSDLDFRIEGRKIVVQGK